MRTLSTAETVRVAAGEYAPCLRVSLEDAGGVFRDVDSYFAGQRFLIGVSLQEDVDGQGPTATITLRRQVFEHSLSPLMLSSGTARGYVPSASPSPPVALYRRVRVEWYVAAVDENVSSPTWTELFVGRVDRVSVADGESVTLECRDANVAVLSDSFFERERLYGLTPAAYAVQKGCLIWAPGETQAVGDLCVPAKLNGYLFRATAITTGVTGTTQPSWPTTVGATVTDGGVTWTCGSATATAGTVSMETVLQQMLNDSPVSLTLYAPDASSFLMSPWKQEREPILEAMRKVSQLIGWDLRPRYDSGGTYRFQLYKPDRVASSPVRTFAPSSYVNVSALDLGIENVRNVVRVVYGDSTDLGSDGKTPKRKYRQATDAASITAYGRRFMEIAEEATSQIDTAAEADALVAAALADLATPYASLEVEALFFPWAQLGDLYRFSANNVHFDSDQDLAVVGYSHEAQLGDDGEQTFRTSLTCRGKPSGGSDRWLQWDSRPGVAPTHSLQDSYGGVELSVVDSAGVAGGARFRIAEKLSRLAKFDGLELHVSESSGFTPSSVSLSTLGKTDTLEVQNLIPGRTYYAKVVPRQLNAGRVVQGEPSSEVSFVAGYAAPRLLQPAIDYGQYPVNGEFEAWTLGASAPPDAWSMNNGTWGTDVTRVSRTVGVVSGGYALNFGTPSGQGRVVTALMKISANSVYKLSVRRRSHLGSDQFARIEWLDAAQGLMSSSDLSLGYTNLQWLTTSAEFVSPNQSVYARLVVGRFSTAGSSTFEVDTIQFEKSAFLATSAVGTTQLADGSVTSAKLDTNLVVTGNLGAGVSSASSKLHLRGSGNLVTLETGASTGVQNAFLLQDGTTSKWQFGKDGDNSFFLWDMAGAKSLLRASSNGGIALYQESWIAPTLLNSFQQYATAGYQPVGYYKDSSGRVFLRGLLERASASSTAIFQLPIGYRPAKTTIFVIMANGNAARLDISSGGNVSVNTAVSATWYVYFSLDGVSFDTR